eukprot:9665068-Alexandrium_andersonii.AAC.1
MSASLVGSEMCIRDRPPPSGNGSKGHHLRRRPFRTRQRSYASTWPVSYTHLTLPTICRG